MHLAGITRSPDDMFMGHAADASLEFLKGMRILIHDRDSKFSLRFRIVLEAVGVELVKTPYQAPNSNAYAERFARSIKDECLSRVIMFGEAHLRRAIDEYLEHFHRERNHQGLGNELIEGAPQSGGGAIEFSERLGGLLKFYHRAA